MKECGRLPNTFYLPVGIHELFIEALLKQVLSEVIVLPQSEKEIMAGHFVCSIPSFINSTILLLQ